MYQYLNKQLNSSYDNNNNNPSELIDVILVLVRKVEVNCENENKAKQTLYKQISAPNDLTVQEKEYEVLQKPNLRLFCSDCEYDITRSFIVITKSDYYCIRCFANLQNYNQEYLVRRALKYTFTNSSWDFLDEVVLITAFKLWGFGNWGQIKEYLDYNGSPFPLKQIEAHFEKYYLNQHEDLPPFVEAKTAKPKYTFAQLNQQIYSMPHTISMEMKKRQSKGEKKPISSFRSLSMISSSKDIDGEKENGSKNQELAEQQMQMQQRRQKQKRSQCSILGYNIKRKQFQLGEYDYTAENMLAQLQFYETDSEEQHRLKLQIIQAYNLRLEQRLKRRSFVIEYKLLDQDYQFNQQCKLDKDVAHFHSFMRFTNNNQEYRNLVHSYSVSKRYEKYITNLRRVRGKVAKEGEIEDAFRYMGEKREKYINKWEKSYNKKYKTKKRNVITLQKREGEGDGDGKSVYVNEDGEEDASLQMPDDPSQIFHKAVKTENQTVKVGNLRVKSMYIAKPSPIQLVSND